MTSSVVANTITNLIYNVLRVRLKINKVATDPVDNHAFIVRNGDTDYLVTVSKIVKEIP